MLNFLGIPWKNTIFLPYMWVFVKYTDTSRFRFEYEYSHTIHLTRNFYNLHFGKMVSVATMVPRGALSPASNPA
jgi:hypothetical protein